MPKYLISYRKTEETGQKPEWTSFTTESEATLEAHAVRERVDKRLSVLGEKLSIVRSDGVPANYTAPGRPIAIISNATVEYTPAPPPPVRPATPVRRKR